MLRASILATLIAAAIPQSLARATEAPSPAPACATSAAPARTGNRISDERLLIGYTLSAVSVAQQRTDKDGLLIYPIASWCAGQTISLKDKQFTFWHNVSADAPNASGPFDRLVPAKGDPKSGLGAVTLIADRGPRSRHDGDEPPGASVVYHVVLESEDEILILGSYDGPLPAEQLAAFVPGGYVPINARVLKKTHQVTLYRMQ